MPRRPRQLESNVVYHVYNRRVEKRCLFETDADYGEFLRLVRCAKQKYPVRLHAYCLMTNHWHLALSAERTSAISRFLGWLTGEHARYYRFGTGTVGLGHVYQGRFEHIPVDGVVQYVRLIRYIEANPVAAGLVSRAQDWRWSSLQERATSATWLDAGPWTLPEDWADLVNCPETRLEMLPGLLGQIALFRPEPISFH